MFAQNLFRISFAVNLHCTFCCAYNLFRIPFVNNFKNTKMNAYCTPIVIANSVRISTGNPNRTNNSFVDVVWFFQWYRVSRRLENQSYGLPDSISIKVKKCCFLFRRVFSWRIDFKSLIPAFMLDSRSPNPQSQDWISISQDRNLDLAGSSSILRIETKHKYIELNRKKFQNHRLGIGFSAW